MLDKIIKQQFIRKVKGKEPEVEEERKFEVEMTDDGIVTHWNGHDYPYHGFPEKHAVQMVGASKRMIPMALEMMHKTMNQFVPKDPEMYCPAVREIYRVFNIAIERYPRDGMKEKLRKLRNMVCVILQFDDAYRCIFQDILPEIDMDKIKLREEDKYWFQKKTYDWKGKQKAIEKFEKEGKKVGKKDNK